MFVRRLGAVIEGFECCITLVKQQSVKDLGIENRDRHDQFQTPCFKESLFFFFSFLAFCLFEEEKFAE